MTQASVKSIEPVKAKAKQLPYLKQLLALKRKASRLQDDVIAATDELVKRIEAMEREDKSQTDIIKYFEDKATKAETELALVKVQTERKLARNKADYDADLELYRTKIKELEHKVLHVSQKN